MDCERKGQKNKYHAGQRVVFIHLGNDGEHTVLKGTISQIVFENESHRVLYYVPYGEETLTVLEKDIQRTSPIRRAAA